MQVEDSLNFGLAYRVMCFQEKQFKIKKCEKCENVKNVKNGALLKWHKK